MRLVELKIRIRQSTEPSKMFPSAHPAGWYWWFSTPSPDDRTGLNHLCDPCRGPYDTLEDVYEAILPYNCETEVLESVTRKDS